MKPVSEYQTSTSKIWFSPTFRSHQLGYKLRLAVEVKPQPSHLQLNVAIVSAPPEDQPEFVKFPCVGYATVHILNPQHNKRHKDISFGFRISDESDKSMPAAVPNEYIMDDHLFFRVVKVELEEDYKPWLLDPHHEAEDSDSTDSEIESE